MIEPAEDRLLTTQDCAKRWAVSPRAVRKWIDEGLVPAIRLGSRPLIRVALSDVIAVEQSGRIGRVTR